VSTALPGAQHRNNLAAGGPRCGGRLSDRPPGPAAKFKKIQVSLSTDAAFRSVSGSLHHDLTDVPEKQVVRYLWFIFFSLKTGATH